MARRGQKHPGIDMRLAGMVRQAEILRPVRRQITRIEPLAPPKSPNRQAYECSAYERRDMGKARPARADRVRCWHGDETLASRLQGDIPEELLDTPTKNRHL